MDNMLRFIRSKIPQHGETRTRDKQDMLLFRRGVQMGFPSKPTCLAYDSELNLLAIGTRTGFVKIYGAPGVLFTGQHAEHRAVRKLFFLPGQGRLVSLCEDGTLHLWEVNFQEGRSFLEHVREVTTEGRLKTIACAALRGKHLLIGTEGGNVYLLDTESFQLTDHIIYQDVVIQNIPDDYKLNPGPVEVIAVHPSDPSKLLLGYQRGLIVLWDAVANRAPATYICSQQVEALCWHRDGERFLSAHNDGSYVVWNVADSAAPAVAPNTPYGPFPCKPIEKIYWKTTKNDDEFIIFTGGMPRASYGDRHALSVQRKDKQVVFDFSSKIVDTLVLDMFAPDSDTEEPHAVFVLCDEELVAIDLLSPDWPVWKAPYLHAVHASSITAATICADISPAVWDHLHTAGAVQSLGRTGKNSERLWPIQGGRRLPGTLQERDLLITGHEDGWVKFWDVGGVDMPLVYAVNTAALFGEYAGSSESQDDEEWPPFRRVGVFDPYTDDPRFAVQRVAMDAESGALVIGGAAGQITLWQLQEFGKDFEIQALKGNVVGEQDNFVWKGQDALEVRPGTQSFTSGLVPDMVYQVNPPASCVSLALDAKLGVVAIGTAHGFVVVDYVQKRTVFAKCTLAANELAARESVATEGTMSRFKSFKKSLRESFRRRRRPLSPEGGKSGSPDKSDRLSEEGGSAAGKESPPKQKSPDVAATRPVERAVEARTELHDTINSMVRAMCFAHTYVTSAVTLSHTLLVGTNAGAIYLVTLGVPDGEKRSEQEWTCYLVKEIHLRHRAPVMSINVLDGRNFPLDAHPAASGDQLLAQEHGHRLLVVSEEQVKSFHLPTLRPGRHKFKLTAMEGARVRRAQLAVLKAPGAAGGGQSDGTAAPSRQESFVVMMTNQGELQAFSTHTLRRVLNAPCTRRDDLTGINSVVLSRRGEGFHLLGSSEFQRFSIAATYCVLPHCTLDLSPDARPTPIILEQAVPSADALQHREVGAAAEDERSPTTPVPTSMSLLSALGGHEDLNVSGTSTGSALPTDVTVDSIRDYTVETHEMKTDSGTVTVTTTKVVSVSNVHGEHGSTTTTVVKEEINGIGRESGDVQPEGEEVDDLIAEKLKHLNTHAATMENHHEEMVNNKVSSAV